MYKEKICSKNKNNYETVYHLLLVVYLNVQERICVEAGGGKTKLLYIQVDYLVSSTHLKIRISNE